MMATAPPVPAPGLTPMSRLPTGLSSSVAPPGPSPAMVGMQGGHDDGMQSAAMPRTWMGETPEPLSNRAAAARPGGATFGSGGASSPVREREPVQSGVDAEAERGVEEMVFQLKQRFKQSGVTLPLEKHAG